jgi:putative tryptophan/tyrosine transport system ATP-binding protein
MDQGQIILDLQGEERENSTVSNLLQKFNEKSGREFLDDRVLLNK